MRSRHSRQTVRWATRSRPTGRILVAVTLLMASVAGFVATPRATAAWYSGAYGAKESITIDHTKVGLASVDATSSKWQHNMTGAATWSHTTGTQSNRLLVVSVQLDGGSAAAGATASTVTYNGTSLTKSTSRQASCNFVALECEASIWYLVNPTSGAHNVIVTPSTTNAGSSEILAAAMTLYDANQTTPIGSTNTSFSNTSVTPHAVTVSSTTANQMVIDSLAESSNNCTANASQTVVTNVTGTVQITGCVSYKRATTATTTMTWTPASTNPYAIAAIAVNPAPLTNYPLLVSTTDTDLRTTGNGGSVTNTNG